MFCRKCGQWYNDGSQFCEYCGNTVDENLYDGMGKCLYCGSAMDRADTYCMACGKPASNANDNNAYGNYNYNNAYGNNGNNYNNAYNGANNAYGNNSYGSAGGGNNDNVKIIIIVLAILLAVALAAMIIVFSVNKDSDDDTYNTVEQVVTPIPTPTATPTPIPTPTVYIPTPAPVPAYQPPSEPVRNASVHNYVGSNSYIFASDSRYITSSDLDTYSRDDVRFILNEIYARHGYAFKEEPYVSYFNSKMWYYPMYASQAEAEAYFNSIERSNKNTIIKYEQSHGWR